MKIINPAIEKVIEEVNTDNELTIRQKISNLRVGQRHWAKVPVAHRLEIIVRFGDLVREHMEELSHILTAETGKPMQQSINEIKGAHNRIDHLVANAEKWLKEEMIFEGDTSEKIVFEPLGVIANISAWNFPYNVGYNIFLYALVAGNAVLYKPSEFATLTGIKLRELLWEAGIAQNVFECAVGGGEVGQLLLESDLDGFFFTGSHKTGKYIASQVASKLVPVQLELGGKDPLYVMDDVPDVRQAAVNAAEGAFYNNGQSCCAVERIYVHENIYDEFVAAFVAEVDQYQMGDPLNAGTFIGPVTRKEQMRVIQEQKEDALTKGAKVISKERSLPPKGYYVAPLVLTDVSHTMKVMIDESFGPIIGIQKVGDDEEAIKLMQDTEYGLTAAVFSSDQSRAERVLAQLITGTAYWNCCDRVSPNVPWSGRKNSGIGSTLSYMGIRAFVQPKSYHLRK